MSSQRCGECFRQYCAKKMDEEEEEIEEEEEEDEEEEDEGQNLYYGVANT